MDLQPLVPGQSITSTRRVHTRHEEDLGRIQIADPRDKALVQQSHLDGSATLGKPLSERSGRQVERIGTKTVGPQLPFELTR